MIKEYILNAASKYLEKTIETRRYIHKNPELSFKEKLTSDYILSQLNEIGISGEKFAGNTVVGVIRGGVHSKIIGLRADIDALPIEEKTNLEFSSIEQGIMHACGHDVHTASLLTTARILKEISKELMGDVVLIFQHAEEKLPGGAQEILKAGLFDKYPVQMMIGQHVQPGIPTGVYGFKQGKYMASTDEIYISFKGKGGHAAIPADRSDTVLATAEFLIDVKNNFEQIQIQDLPAILAFGELEAKGAVNIIPDISKVNGTLRCFDESQRKDAKKLIEKTAQNCANKYACKADVNIVNGYPYLHNNEKLTKEVSDYTRDLLGDDFILPLDLRLTAEDFSYFSHRVPSVFYRMGITGNGYGNNSLHSAQFDIDENALKTSPAVMAWITYKVLNG
jgi:amidohydrolase